MTMQPPPQDAPPPGWYPSGGVQRYWDGAQWTEHMAPAGPVDSSNANTWATLSHLPVGGFLIPLLALLIEGPKSEWVKYHSTEALNFHLSTFIIGIVALPVFFILAIVTKGAGFFLMIPLLMLLSVGSLIFGIMGMIAASKGEYYRYPLTLRLIKGPAAPPK